MSYQESYYEFDLVVRKKGFKNEVDPYGNPYPRPSEEREKKAKPEVLEELKFNSMEAVEVVRKLLDYLR